MSDLVIHKHRKEYRLAWPRMSYWDLVSLTTHDTECPYWDQVSLNNTNQTKPLTTQTVSCKWSFTLGYGLDNISSEDFLTFQWTRLKMLKVFRRRKHHRKLRQNRSYHSHQKESLNLHRKRNLWTSPKRLIQRHRHRLPSVMSLALWVLPRWPVLSQLVCHRWEHSTKMPPFTRKPCSPLLKMSYFQVITTC